MDGNLEYISDTLLIEKTAKLTLVLSDDNELVKNAQIASMLGGVASSIYNEVKSKIDTSSTGSTIKSVLNLLAPAALFRLNPLFGILYSIGSEMFGIDLGDIVSKIMGFISPKLTSGQKLNPDDVNQAGKSVLASLPEIGEEEPEPATASLLSGLYELEKTGQLTKAAVWPFSGRSYYGGSGLGGGALLFPRKGTTPLHRIFGFLGPGKGKNMLVGFVVWLIKTVLVSAGLMAGASALTGALGIKHEPKPEIKPEVETSQTIPASSEVQTQLQSQIQQPKQDKDIVFEPTNGMPLDNLIASWAVEHYPQLSGYEGIIMEDPSFKRILGMLSMNQAPGAKFVVLPEGIADTKQLADAFAPRIIGQISQLEP